MVFKLNKNLEWIVSLVMIIVLIPVTTFASSNNMTSEDIQFAKLSNSSIKVTENGESSIIIFRDKSDEIKVSVQDVSSKEITYFVANKKTGIIYSSETGESVSIKEILGDEPLNDSTTVNQDKKSISKKAESGYVGKINKQISYKQLSRLVTASSSAASIAGAILTILGWAGLTVTNPIASVISIIGGIVTVVQLGIKSKSSKHGIKLTLKKYKHVRYRSGMKLVRYTYSLAGAQKY